MGTDITVARAQDAIPVVQSTSDRATRFPTPADNQRVQNLGTGNFERFSVASNAWVTDVIGRPAKTFALTDPTYGGAADGVTNDTAALLAAITAAGNAGGGIVQLPAGTILADPPTTSVPANVTVRGAGREQTVVQAVTVNGCWHVTDASHIALEDFTFVGVANNGATTTTEGIAIHAATVDVTDIAVRRVGLRQFKPDAAALRFYGNGDYTTNATAWVRRVWIEDCHIREFYDTDPTNLGVACYGIYGGCGSQDVIVRNNVIDGSYGKHGICSLAEMQRFTIDGNHVLNCGKLTASPYYGYGIIAYSGTGTPCTDVRIVDNDIDYTNRAGIYIQSVNRYSITGNVLNRCDQHTAGPGNVGVGAIMVNNSANDARQGPGTITGNVFSDWGYCAIYVNTATYGLNPLTISGNTGRMTTPGTQIGVVVNGMNAVIDGNAWHGVLQGLFLYTITDLDTGSISFTNNEVDMTGTSGGSGIASYNAVRMSRLVVSGNRFANGTSGVALPVVEDVVLTGNMFTAISGTSVAVTANRGVVNSNTADGGTLGLNLACKPSTATARVMVVGNVMSACTTPCTVTANTGTITKTGNDFA